MSRSVSTDLELDAGTYSVLMKITATRWPTDSTPEDIIRDNCKNRQAKLIQIGLAYDLAHARGIIRETEAEKEKKEEKAIKKKQTEKKKKLDAKREEKLKEWQYNKKLKAREKRRVRKREDYERKMAEARKAAGKDESSVVKETAPAAISNVNAANAGAGLEAEIEKQAAAGAKETQVGEPAPDVASLPSPPAETRLEEAKATNGALPVVPEESAATKKEEDSGATDAAMTTSEDKTGGAKSNDVPSTEAAAEAPDKSNTDGQKSQPSESALPSVPTVTINGELAPADAAIGNAGPADAAPPPSVGALSSLAPDDDYQYDSDASFDSSIDSVLDFFDSAPEYARQPPGSAVVEEELSPSEPVEGDEEFENDPWNAVCVVGLRVYSKDEGCKVGVRRPKQDGDEDTPLDLDDASKGASGEKEGDDKNKDEVKVDEGVVGKGTGAVKGG